MFYVGFDIGGTKCAVSLGESTGEKIKILERYETPTTATPQKTFDFFAPIIKGWQAKYPIKSAGISCGGPLDSEKGVIISTPNLSTSWHGFPIAEHIQAEFGLSAKLENDANACAVAEWKFGAGVGAKNMIFMTFGTGLGAGLILNGKLYSGTNGNAGEIGHIRLSDEGPVGYHKKGSAEGFCSGNGIKNLYLLRAKEQGKNIEENITTKVIFERARKGDEFAKAIIKESAEKFAKVLSLLIDLFNPEVITAGGVFMRNYDIFMPIITSIIEAEALTDAYKVCKILPAKIGENIGDYAALSIAAIEAEK